MKSIIVLEITHKNPIPELTDLVANRIWSMDHVDDVSASFMGDDSKQVHEITGENKS